MPITQEQYKIRSAKIISEIEKKYINFFLKTSYINICFQLETKLETKKSEEYLDALINIIHEMSLCGIYYYIEYDKLKKSIQDIFYLSTDTYYKEQLNILKYVRTFLQQKQDINKIAQLGDKFYLG